MKAKKMTQKLTLLTFTALFIAFMFNACSDVASPNDDLSGYSDSGLISQENDNFADARRRAIATQQTFTEAQNVTNCTLKTEIIGYGPLRNRTQTGTLTPSIDGNYLTLHFQATGNYAFSETRVYVENTPPTQQWDDFDQVFHDPATTDTKRENISLEAFGPGDTIYIAAKAQSVVDGNGNGQSATAGDEGPFQAQFRYFVITNECPPETGSYFGGAN